LIQHMDYKDEMVAVLTSALPEYTWRVTYVPPSDPFVIVVAYDKLGKAHFLRITLAIIDGSMHFGKCGSISLADPQSLEEVHNILKHCIDGVGGVTTFYKQKGQRESHTLHIHQRESLDLHVCEACRFGVIRE